MRNYYFTSVWVSVSGSGADSVLCSLFGVLYFRLEIYLSVSGFGFFILLVCFFWGFCTPFSGYWVFVLYYGHQGKLSVFFKLYDSILYFVILVLVLPFWNLSFCFRFWGFGFACMLFFRVLDVYFPVLNVCFVLRASRKTFSFLHCMILFCILWFWFYLVLPFWICVSVLGFGFPFWVLWYVFSLSATIYLTAVCL